MKKLFCSILALFALSAQAVDLPQSFKATTASNTPTTITLGRIASFECSPGQVITVRDDTNPAYFIDTGGALCAKLQAQPDFASKWVKQPGADRWFQVSWNSMQCSPGGTQVTYVQTFQPMGDGCQLDTLVKAKSN